MFCEKCGTNLPDGARVFNACGAPVESAPPSYVVAEPAPAHPVPVAPVYAPQAQPAYAAAPVQTAYAPQQQQSSTYPGQLDGNEPLSLGQYLVMLLLMLVPILNLVMLFVWGFGSSSSLNRKNFARAMLIVSAIMLVISLISSIFLATAVSALFNSYSYY